LATYSPAAGVWVPRDDPSVVKIFSKLFGREIVRKGPLLNRRLGIAGKGPEVGVLISDELSSKAGGRVQHEMFYKLTGRGRVGVNERLKGNLEGMKRSTWEHYVDLFRHGVEAETRMTKQQVQWDAAVQATDRLATWWYERDDQSITLQGCAYSVVTDPAYARNSIPSDVVRNPIRAIHADYIFRPNAKADASALGPGDEIGPDLCNQAEQFLKVLRPPIAPMKLPDGSYGYLWNVSAGDKAAMLKTDSGFYNALIAAIQGGKLAGNPLFTGRLIGRWGMFYFVENPHLPPGLDGDDQMVEGTTRGFILGANGLCVGYGRGDRPAAYGLENRYLLETDTEDWIIGQWAGSCICGFDRPGYIHPDEKNTPGATEREVGVVVVETYSPLPPWVTDYDTVYQDFLQMGVAKSWA
jgi:hypothetical protein